MSDPRLEVPPWTVWTDPLTGRRKRVEKPLTSHPVVRELATRADFVERARQWSFHVGGPTSTPNVSGNWHPWVPSPFDGVAEYWYALHSKTNAHRPGVILETFDSVEAAAQFYFDLSAANPALSFGQI